MKAPQEIKRWVAKRRSQSGKKNGVVTWIFEQLCRASSDYSAQRLVAGVFTLIQWK
ncbi:MAG: hypothetical protein Q7S87_08545 [Agitococcus sp.]|nr:hypothetical protein [Agitococcus sp.]MDO9177618.1 hypothetical protein [Agitococcus sp.]